jgi:hypothetical protein
VGSSEQAFSPTAKQRVAFHQIPKRHQPDLVSPFRKNSAEMMSPAARFHRHDTRWQPLDKSRKSLALYSSPQGHFTAFAEANKTADILAKSIPRVAISIISSSLMLGNHTMRQKPSLPADLAAAARSEFANER